MDFEETAKENLNRIQFLNSFILNFYQELFNPKPVLYPERNTSF